VKKSMKRTLSLLLALTMVLSLGLPAYAVGAPAEDIAITEEPAVKTANLPIGAGKQPGIIEEDEIISDDLIVDIVDEETVVEEQAAPAKDFSYSESATGFSVEVSAPAGALPLGTEMVVDRLVDLSDVQAAVDRAENLEGKVRLAADISFWLNGQEIEPAAGTKLLVRMSSPEIEGIADPIVVHIPDGVNAVPEIVEQMKADDDVVLVNTVEFETDSFSTYAIVSGEDTITVHWGTMNGEKFEEFDETMAIGLDTSASSVSLNVDFEGYAYNGAYFVANNTEDQIIVSSVLKKVDGKWQAEKHVTNAETGNVELIWEDLAAGDIYVIYVVPAEGTEPGAPGSGEKVPTPKTLKHVEENDDGTRTIVLDITGTTITETDEVGANVLILLDRTYSMSGTMADGTRRVAAAKTAVNTLVTKLKEGKGKVNYALLDFTVASRSGSVTSYTGYNLNTLHRWNATTGAHQSSGGVYWTQNADAFNQEVQNNYNYYNGYTATNWESPLTDALTILNSRNTANKTYVLFVTDGEANCRGTQDYNLSTSYLNYYNGLAVKAITDNSDISFYGIFCGNDAGYQTLKTLVDNNNGKDTINGANSTDMERAFGDIAHTIVEEMGANNVSVDDGVPSLSSVSAQTSGEAGGFEYYTVDKDGNETVWAEAPGASYNQANGVTWDLSSVNVTPDVTYRLKFTVWPSQEAYDYIANLNNGLVDPMPTDAELKAMGIEKNSSGVYYLLTNTHLKTDFSFGDKDYSVSPSTLPTGEMILPTTTIKITKIWNNDLDWRTASEVRLTVTKDGQPYLFDDEENDIHNAIPMGDAVKTGENEWTQTNSTEIYISMGQLTLDSNNNINVISSGHDYTVTEPESFSYYWSLTSDVYHPMLVNGEQKVLVQVKDEDVPDALKTLENNKKATAGGLDYYKFNNKLYVVKSGQNVLTAVNDRRSNLNLTKAVTGNDIPADALFTYTVKLENPKGKYEGAEGYNPDNDDFWFNIGEPVLDDQGNPVLDDDGNPTYNTVTTDGLVEGATAASGNTSYHFANVKGGKTVTIKIRAGWNVRFFNLANGTTYEIIESDMADGFVYTKVEGSADNGGTAGTPDNANQKITGSIDKPNNVFTVTFTNEYKGCFYVYHAGDNTIERIFFTDSRIVDRKFNIAKETKDHYIYGGYYKDFADKGTFDVTTASFVKATEAVATTYDGEHKDGYWFTVTEGSPAPYRGDASKWTPAQAYTENGTAMEPKANTIYYLKEVPDAFIRIALRYTYYMNSTYNVGTVWLVCAIDGDVDNGYKDFGLMNYEDGSVIANVKAEDGMPKAVIAGANVDFTAKTTQTSVRVDASDLITKMRDSFFDSNKGPYTGNVAYVTVRDKSIYGNSDSGMTENLIDSEQKTMFFFVTPDNIQVTSARVASVKNINGVASKGVEAKRITLQKFGLRDNSEELSTYISTLKIVSGD